MDENKPRTLGRAVVALFRDRSDPKRPLELTSSTTCCDMDEFDPLAATHGVEPRCATLNAASGRMSPEVLRVSRMVSVR